MFPDQKYDIDQIVKDEIAFFKSEVERLTHYNQALRKHIVAVCDHENLCRK